MNLSYKFSKLLSIVLHPMFMPLYGAWLLFNTRSYLSFTTNPAIQNFIYAIIFVCTAVIPALLSYMLWQTGKISSLEMPERKERYAPFFLTLLSYFGGIYLLYKLPVPRFFGIILTGGAILIAVSFIINLRWKISVHMSGIGGLMGLMYGYALFFHAKMIMPLIVISVCAGFLAMARQVLKAHDASQVYGGFLSGFLVQFAFMYFLFHDVSI